MYNGYLDSSRHILPPNFWVCKVDGKLGNDGRASKRWRKIKKLTRIDTCLVFVGSDDVV